MTLAKYGESPTLGVMAYLRHPGAVLLFLAFVVHACVPLAAHRARGRVDTLAFNSLDCGEFYRLAVNLAQNGTFSQDGPPLLPPYKGGTEESSPYKGETKGDSLSPDTWRTPGYPMVLAVFIAVLGASPAVLVLVQQFLGVLSVWLLFRIAREHMTPRRAAVVAGIFLFAPYRLHYSLWLMSTTLFTTVLLLIWLVWQRANPPYSPLTKGGHQTVTLSEGGLEGVDADSKNAPSGVLSIHDPWPWCILAGGLSGFAILVRPVAVLLPVALVVGVIVTGVRNRSGGPNLSRLWRSLAAFAVCCLLIVGVWMGRNLAVAGHFALSSQGGVVLSYFKAAEVVLWNEDRTADRYAETSLDPDRSDEPHGVWNAIDSELRERFQHLSDEERASLSWRNLAQGNKTSIDSFEISKELARIGRAYLTDQPLGTAACCLVRCGSILTFPLNLAIRPATGIAHRPLRSLGLALPYVLLCVAVVIRLLRGGLRFHEAFFPLACTAALLLATTPQIDPRFRVPMIPMLLLVAFLPGVGRSHKHG